MNLLIRLRYQSTVGYRGRVLLCAMFAVLSVVALNGPDIHCQTVRADAIAKGSATAKGGFRNEDEIRDKLNGWRTDNDARTWLGFIGVKHSEVISVAAIKPHGEKADVLVTIETRSGVRKEGISIKLVSGEQGFNQIDKRWLRQYAAKWKMPADVEAALKLFVGEVKPGGKPSRNAERMFLNELTAEQQKRIVDFFSANKAEIVSDLLSGDGQFAAQWMMVALKSSPQPRWVLRSIDHVIKFYSEGPVEITRQGNLKIGRITMQRKGGDGGRETANMLQFKINPALLFEGK
jgi:hypothetical protein